MEEKMKKRFVKIVLICLLLPAMALYATGCATTSRVQGLEDQIKAVSQKADDAKSTAEGCCAKSDEALAAAKQAADRAETAAQNAQDSADKAEAVFKKHMNK